MLQSNIGNISKLNELFSKQVRDRVHVLLSNPVSTQMKEVVRCAKRLLSINPEALLYNESFCISDAYREACQDLFMIRVFELSVPDYLVFLDRHRHDTGKLDEISKVDSLRISMVCDYLLATSQDPPLTTVFTLNHVRP